MDKEKKNLGKRKWGKRKKENTEEGVGQNERKAPKSNSKKGLSWIKLGFLLVCLFLFLFPSFISPSLSSSFLSF